MTAPLPPTAAPIAFDGVSFSYAGGERVIDAVTGAFAPARLTALLGPNGAGKSTLLQLALGVLEPVDGLVTLAGRPLASVPQAERAAMMSYVPQRASVGFAFTVEEVVRMGRFALGKDDDAIEHAIHACDLATLRGRDLRTLSFGQQQRALLARAIAQSRGRGVAMLLDEPGSAMDLRHTHDMMRQLVQLARAGTAVAIVMHDLNLAARYADDVWLLDEGRLVAAGDWQSVLTPQRLEPVYRVRLRNVDQSPDQRPVFTSDPLAV